MSTPTLARATEAIEALWPDTPWPGVRELPSAEDEARAAVSAALHDPNGVLAAVIDNHDPEVRFWPDGLYKETYCYGCGTMLPTETYGPSHIVDALRAEILGEAS